jgi:hypothetical protein
MSVLHDLLKGVGNDGWDLARLSSAWAIISFSGAFLYALIGLGKVPDWSALGVGYAAVLTGAAAFVAGKDMAKAKAQATPPSGENNAA